MTRRLLSITLAVLTVGLLGSCSKINDRIDSLEGRIDRIESDRIASIDQQIAAINSSISDLGTIRQNIQNLIDTADGQEKDINSLKTADASLGQRIDELKAYTDETLKAYAKSDWVKATFATLEQHEWTCDTVAKIDARIGKIDAKLTESIEDSKESLRSWVNAQMESYYTAAQMDAKLAELLSKITTASGESEAKANSLAKELKEAKSAIATVKTELTEAYQSAIEKAIKTSEGKLTSKISSSVSSVNSKVSSLSSRVSDLENDVNNLKDRVSALEQMIQSVTLVQAYSDGSVSEEDGKLKLELIISPASAATGLTKENFKVLVTEVITKASSIQTLDVESVVNNGEGSLTLTADISECTCTAGHSLSVAVKVVKDKSDLTTEFVTVSAVPVTGVSLNKTELKLTLFGTETLSATIAPSNATDKTVTWSSSNESVAGVDSNGKVTAVAVGTANIIVKTNDGAKTDTCTVNVIDWVEIGGLKWAIMNLGASTVANSLSTCAGDYYQWGSVNTLYNEIPWGTLDGSGKLTINSWKDGKSSGFVAGNREYPGTASVLPDANDVVKQTVGNGWRIPTKEDFDALINACIYGEYDKNTYKETACGSTTSFAKGIYWCANYDGVAGCLFCDGTNKVFFPAAGQGGNATNDIGPKQLTNPDTFGLYWSSNLCNAATEGGVPTSYSLNFWNSNVKTSGVQGQYGGVIRPVKD